MYNIAHQKNRKQFDKKSLDLEKQLQEAVAMIR